MSTHTHSDRPTPTRVVILGGGFAGISAAAELGRRTRRRSDVEVHLVSDENYFVFQPMLPEVVACGIEPGHILNPIRQLCRDVIFHCASVQAIDIKGSTVTLSGRDARRVQTIHYDHLVVALGLTIDLSRIPGLAEHSLPIKTLGDAFHLRNHVLSRLEEADIEPDEETRRKLLTIVGVGGGFSGVETVAELNDMVKAVLKFYPRAQSAGHRMILIHSRDRILNELSESLGRFAQKKLTQRGVEIILNTRLSEVTADGVLLSDGRQIPAGTVVSSVGNAPHPLIEQCDFPRDRGRVTTDEFLRVVGGGDDASPNVWALGDSALVPDVAGGGHCPPTAQYAMRQGKRVAKNVLAAIDGKPLKPFVFGGLGQLAVVGHRCGVAQVFGFQIAGLLAWFLWRSVYWTKLPGMRAKIRVGIDWALDAIFPRDITKLDVQRTELLRRAHYRQGETIIQQGEIGDKFYIIESGEVEIVQEAPGQPERRLATRSAGESFGEVALLKDTLRTATVRCLTPVDVVTFNRQDFKTLVGSYDAMRHQMEQRLREINVDQTNPPNDAPG